jgi:hypothetical protein
MAILEKVQFEITTATGGAYTSAAVDVVPPVLLYAVEWIDGDLADGVDATVKSVNNSSGVDVTLLTLTNADNDAWYYPTVVENDNAGAALTSTRLPVVAGQLQLAVTSGGDAKVGKCIVYLMR